MGGLDDWLKDNVRDNAIKVVSVGALDGWDDVKAIGDDIQGGLDDVRGKTQARAQEEAAEKQNEFFDRMLAFQKEMYADQQANYKPWRDIGLQAMQRLSQGMTSGQFSAPSFSSSGGNISSQQQAPAPQASQIMQAPQQTPAFTQGTVAQAPQNRLVASQPTASGQNTRNYVLNNQNSVISGNRLVTR